MDISVKVSDQVGPTEMRQGALCFYRGSVTITYGSTHSVISTVSGKGIYEVSLETLGSSGLDFSCTCSDYERYQVPCKHVWATLLAADRDGYLGVLSRSSSIDLFPLAGSEDDFWDRFPTNGVDGLGGPPAHLSRIVKPKGGRRESGPTWRNHLLDLQSSQDSGGHHRKESLFRDTEYELIYVVNRERTVEENLLVVEIFKRTRKKNGEWGKSRRFDASISMLEKHTDPADQQIIPLFLGAEKQNHWERMYYDFHSRSSSFALHQGMYDTLIPLMSRTGRFYMAQEEHADPGADPLPLSLDEGPPWTFQLECRLSEEKKQWILRGVLNRAGVTIDLDKPLLILKGGWLLDHSGMSRLDHGSAFRWISLLRREKSLQVPADEADSLLELFYKSRNPPPIEWPDSLKPVEMKVPPHQQVRIWKSEEDRRKYPRLRVGLEFRYGDEVVPMDEPRDKIYMREDNRLLFRDRETEAAAWAQLGKRGCRPPPANVQYRHNRDGQFLELTPRRLPALVNGLVKMGWTVEAEGALYRKAGSFSMSVHSGVDWFDLEGHVDFDGTTVAFPRLLEALKRNKNTVLLDDGTFGVVPEAWLKRFGFLLSAGTAHEDRLRFQPSQISLLDALLATEGEKSWDKSFGKARAALQRFEGIKPREAPAGFQGSLRSYQKEGLGWFAFLSRFGFGGCLADDMGLGKTVQVLALLESRHRAQDRKKSARDPSLVVMPRSLVFNWLSEAARFTPKLRVLDYTGPARRKEADRLKDYDVVLTTYGTLRSDVLLLKEIPFDHVVLDESQAIKNRASQTAKAARLIKGRFRLGLSGTPIENHLDELFSLFEFLNPGMLGALKAFKNFIPSATSDESGENGEEANRMLARIVRPFILRRTKQAVLQDLPEKLEQTLYCDLDAEERKRYDEIREYYRASLLGKVETVGLNRAKIQVLEALLRLRQAACHPGLLDRKLLKKSSTKINMLLDRLCELQEKGRKVLVFSQFTSLLAIVRGRLEADHITYEYLDGRTRKRGVKVDRFQNDPECKLFLISLKAGGLGLNLTAAEYVFVLDPWWNPAVESQAIDRAHRIGQRRKVFAYRLIARDTVEEKVVELQQKKRRLADAIISAESNVIRDLTRKDLEFILS